MSDKSNSDMLTIILIAIVLTGLALLLSAPIYYTLRPEEFPESPKFVTIERYTDCTLVYDRDTGVEYYKDGNEWSPAYDESGNIVVYRTDA